ncbi:hypothetical protein OM190_24765 [Escherichia albertii]|nr:hypothetical protein [Escherichia coli]EJM9604474.1 hypothetical protein [Escherichia albertii]EGD0494567.1 hypothetical protein [Escherichia coli]MCZ8930849.1 hypothetical protein [Escherichia albertii]MCZ8998600.1 hypothetical protein [Escherichia albertii]
MFQNPPLGKTGKLTLQILNGENRRAAYVSIFPKQENPFSGEGAIMFVIPVPLKRNTPFRRSWWTQRHVRLTLRVSIADPQTTTRQQNVTRFSRSMASLAPLS